MTLLFFQDLNRGRAFYTTPHDSTIGTGPGFYWFSLAVIIFLVGGTSIEFYKRHLARRRAAERIAREAERVEAERMKQKKRRSRQ